MRLLSIFSPKPLLPEAGRVHIVEAIRTAELKTSGEVRVYMESHCRFVDALDRAAEVFHGLSMEKTAESNAVLVYVAIKDQQLAVYADEGIYNRAGSGFWNEAVRNMLLHFNKNDYATGIADVVSQIGEALAHHFPYHSETDKNELPDDIVFGK